MVFMKAKTETIQKNKKEKKPVEAFVELPEGYSAKLESGVFVLKTPKNELKKELYSKKVSIKIEGNKVVFRGRDHKKSTKKIMGTLVAHLKNLIKGAEKEFEYKLAVVFSHFPIKLAVKPDHIEITNFFGEKHPRKVKLLPETKVEVKGNEILVKSQYKDRAGQVAAGLENATKVSSKDRRIFQDGIYIVKRPE
jgi:large subunit ribosomal protein L6